MGKFEQVLFRIERVDGLIWIGNRTASMSVNSSGIGEIPAVPTLALEY